MKTAVAAAEPDQPRSGFHTRGGWYFRRGADGSVTIWSDSPRPGRETTLDAATWASVVASVSALGETRQTYDAALALHAGNVAAGGGVVWLDP